MISLSGSAVTTNSAFNSQGRDLTSRKPTNRYRYILGVGSVDRLDPSGD